MTAAKHGGEYNTSVTAPFECVVDSAPAGQLAGNAATSPGVRTASVVQPDAEAATAPAAADFMAASACERRAPREAKRSAKCLGGRIRAETNCARYVRV